MSDEKESHEPSGKSSHAWALWCALTLLVAYPLSIGPAAKFYPDPHGWGSVFYAPVIHLYHTSPPVQHFFDWYLGKVWRID